MPTDQKVGGSSPSERAQVNGPYPFRGGAFLVSVGAMLGATTADPGAAARWLARLDPTAAARAPGACEEDGQDKEGVSGSHRPEYPARPASV